MFAGLVSGLTADFRFQLHHRNHFLLVMPAEARPDVNQGLVEVVVAVCLLDFAVG
jgi:hypothetical protein